MNDPVLVDKLAELALAFPRQEMRPETLEVYAKHLADLPSAAVSAAIDRAIATATFPPSIGEIRAAVADLALGDAVQPETAWGEVLREVRRVGYNHPPVFRDGRFLPPEVPTFSDPRIAEAVEATGWGYICTGEPLSTVKAQFERTLRAVCDRASRRVQTGRLPDGTPIGSGPAAGLRALPAERAAS